MDMTAEATETDRQGEDRAEQFLRRFGLDVESIPETDTKTPDFRVSDIHGFVFYVEVKSIDPYPEEDGLIWDRVQKRLQHHLDKASKQFAAVNSAHIAPNVLVWIADGRNNIHSVEDLVMCLRGIMVIPDVEPQRARPEYARRKIVEYQSNIDLFILISEFGQDGFLFNSGHRDFTSRLARIFGRSDQ